MHGIESLRYHIGSAANLLLSGVELYITGLYTAAGTR